MWLCLFFMLIMISLLGMLFLLFNFGFGSVIYCGLVAVIVGGMIVSFIFMFIFIFCFLCFGEGCWELVIFGVMFL